jgi:small conductance mechanosensitive channel
VPDRGCDQRSATLRSTPRRAVDQAFRARGVWPGALDVSGFSTQHGHEYFFDKFRFMHYRTFIALAAILLVFIAATPASAQSVLDQIDEIRAAAAVSVAAEGDEIDTLAGLRERLKRELKIGDLLGKARAEDDATRLEGFISQHFKKLEALATDVQGRVTSLVQNSRKVPVSEQLDIEYRLRSYDEVLGVLFAAAIANASRASALGIDASSALAALDDRLQQRAARQADRLKDTLSRIESAAAQVDKAPESAKSDLETGLVVLEERRQRLKSALGRTIELLRERGLETSEYVQILFRSTGVISSDLLDSVVLKGLLAEWALRTRNALVENGPDWIFRIGLFVLILVVARMFGKFAARVVGRALAAEAVPLSNLMQAFFVKLTLNLVFLFGVLIALSQIGVNLGPVLAGLGIAGFIVGFALQDTLSNFASGMMILLYRPYDIGDVVEAAGVSGKVHNMNLVSTTIVTFDNQKLVVPNNKIWGDVIRNVNAAENRRVDLTFGIGYDDDIAAAETLLNDIIESHELVLEDPEPTIKLHRLGESSVDFIVRPWVRAENYWAVYWDVTRAVKQRFDEAGITIPYPQRDVHIFNETKP